MGSTISRQLTTSNWQLVSSAGKFLKFFKVQKARSGLGKSFEKTLRIFSGFRTWTRQNQVLAWFTNVFGAFCLQNGPVFLILACFVSVLTSEKAVLTFNIWAKVRDPGKSSVFQGGRKVFRQIFERFSWKIFPIRRKNFSGI